MRNSDPILRAMYIILVPVVALIILLNSGILQKNMTAATVNGESYNVVRYNYYYFDYYNSFLEENEDRLTELGFDPNVSEANQNYSLTTTWREFFQAEAEAILAETAYYYNLAVEAGYEFSEEELAPVENQLAKNREDQTNYGVKAKNYYISYYGSGMTEELYTLELTRQVKAQAYKAYLAAAYEHSEEALNAWIEANGVEDYPAAHIKVITLDALPDRETGKVGAQQIAALNSKLDKLTERYEAGASFDELQQMFSSCALGDKTGTLIAVGGQVPEVLVDWCREGNLIAGDMIAVVDEETGTAFLAVFERYSESGAKLQAAAALSAAMQEAELQRIKESCSVEYSTLGILLAMS